MCHRKAMREIRHVVWDWNGTLLNDIDACVAAINVMLRRRRLPVLNRRTYRQIFGFPVKQCYYKLGFDFSRESWDAVAKEYHDIYAGTSKKSSLRPRTLRVLDRLRNSGVIMTVLSASKTSILEEMIRTHGIRDYFAVVKGLPDLFAHSKMDLGREVLRETGIPGRNTVLVGDTTHDAEVAECLGLECVLMCGGHQPRCKLEKCRGLLVGGMGALSSVLFHERRLSRRKPRS